MEKIVLIDGHSILNRAYYGIPTLTNSEGLHTNAIYGFLNIMFKILEEESPEYLAVAFDLKAPTFRHKMYAEYKGTRKPMDEELREQVPVIKEVLKAMRIKTVELEGYEADDVLGTIAKTAEKQDIAVSLVSGDRDLLQIATDKIKIRIPKTKGSKTEIFDYYAKDVKEEYNVTPAGFIELKALMGDTADNIPGVPKVGEKTAAELMNQFGSLDNIFANVEDVSKNAVRESLKNNKDLAYLSLKLATICTEAPLDFKFEDARIKDFYTDEAYQYFKRLGFKNMLDRFSTKVDYKEITAAFSVTDDYNEAVSFIDEILKKKSDIGLSLIFDDKTKTLLGIAIAKEGKTIFIKKQYFITDDFLKDELNKLYSEGIKIATHHVKEFYSFIDAKELKDLDDVIIGTYLTDPTKADPELIDIANDYIHLMLKNKDQRFGKLSLAEAMDQNEGEFTEFVCFEAYTCLKAAPVIKEKLKEYGELKLYEEIEMPLSLCLYEMEKEGIRVIPSLLKEYSEMLKDNIVKLEKRIYEEAGCEFNINSPKQLGEILFEKLNIPGGKKTKTGYSTAQDVLNKLSMEYPVVKDILEYRTYSKLKSTYADGLYEFIDENDRIHSTFQQTVTATGRLSSTDPNLQNIPMRTELGRQIRKVFVPQEGHVFIDADYSQIELRVLASLAQDEKLIKAYSEHADIHRITASNVFKVPFEEVTDLQRRNAKAVNFGIVYGISAFGLGEDLGISQKEAKKYIEDYFITYPKVKEFLDKTVKDAKENGYSTTYFGRRRPIPELFDSNFMRRSFGERVAMNSPIQGTAADIIKIAMLRTQKALKEKGLKSKLILQIHDELLIEAPKDEEETVKELLKEAMINAASLAVKLEIDMHVGNDWYEAK